jgi:hypothetical protein
MGQFKPMVKMETTEPSVTLNLKKGGSASFMRMIKEGVPKMGDKKPVKKADGGMMGALARSSPMLKMPMGDPGAARALAAKRMAARPIPPPSMAARPAMGRMPMKDGGKPMKKAEGGAAETAKEMKMDKAQDKAMIMKAFKQHDAQEHKGAKGTKLELKKGGKPMKKATGGVVNGQGGYATGGVVDGQGGYATGGVVNGQGGYKKGGAAKKPFATGGEVNSGAPVKMPQGSKPKPGPVEITQLAGTYKRGGKVR